MRKINYIESSIRNWKREKTIYSKRHLKTSKGGVIINCALIFPCTYFVSLLSYHWPNFISHAETLNYLESPYLPYVWLAKGSFLIFLYLVKYSCFFHTAQDLIPQGSLSWTQIFAPPSTYAHLSQQLPYLVDIFWLVNQFYH